MWFILIQADSRECATLLIIFIPHSYTFLFRKHGFILSEVKGSPSVRLRPLLLAVHPAALSSTVRGLGKLHHPRLSQSLVGEECHNLRKHMAGCGFRE